LTRDELQDLVAQNGLLVRDRRVRDQLIEAVVGSRTVDLTAHLVGFSRDRLKAICRSLDLDDKGKEKAGIVARILAEHAGAAKPARQTALDLEPTAEGGKSANGSAPVREPVEEAFAAMWGPRSSGPRPWGRAPQE